MSQRDHRILLVSLLRKGCGNTCTIHRISSYLEKSGYTCLLRDPSEFKSSDDFLSFLSNNEIQACVGLHAFRAGIFLKDCPVPYMLMLGGTDLNEFYKDGDKLNIMTKAVKNAKILVAFNKSLKTRALELWPEINPRNIWKIPQAVTVSPSSFNLHDYLKIRRIVPQGLSERLNIFLFMGSIRPVKDPFYLLSAFSDWHNKNPSNYYLLVGQEADGDYYQKFLKTIKSLPGIIHIQGLPLEDAHAAIRDSFALVNSSVSEGMPLAVLEAMKLGTPVIARGNRGNRDIIEDDMTGFLFDNPMEFIEKAESLVNDGCIRNTILTNCEVRLKTCHLSSMENQQYVCLMDHLVGHFDMGEADFQTVSSNIASQPCQHEVEKSHATSDSVCTGPSETTNSSIVIMCKTVR